MDGRRELSECDHNQRLFVVTLTTGNSPEETSFQLIGPSADVIGMAPESDQPFQDNTEYTFQYCIWAGYKHTLKWTGSEGNGMVRYL